MLLPIPTQAGPDDGLGRAVIYREDMREVSRVVGDDARRGAAAINRECRHLYVRHRASDPITIDDGQIYLGCRSQRHERIESADLGADQGVDPLPVEFRARLEEPPQHFRRHQVFLEHRRGTDPRNREYERIIGEFRSVDHPRISATAHLGDDEERAHPRVAAAAAAQEYGPAGHVSHIDLRFHLVHAQFLNEASSPTARTRTCTRLVRMCVMGSSAISTMVMVAGSAPAARAAWLASSLACCSAASRPLE